MDRGFHLAEAPGQWIQLNWIKSSSRWLLEHESHAEDMMLVNSQREHFPLNGRKPDPVGLLDILIELFRDTMEGALDMDDIQVDYRNFCPLIHVNNLTAKQRLLFSQVHN